MQTRPHRAAITVAHNPLSCPPARRVMATAAPAVEAPATPRVDGLIAPHGGKLINLQLPKDKWEAAIKSCNKTVEASDRNACDVELLSVG